MGLNKQHQKKLHTVSEYLSQNGYLDKDRVISLMNKGKHDEAEKALVDEFGDSEGKELFVELKAEMSERKG